VGVIAIFLGNVFDCVRFGVVISLFQVYVEKSVDHEMKCCMFVLSRAILCVVYDS
jgi:hypothetical protein